MSDDRNLRPIASLYCTQYETNVKFYIDDAHPSGDRHLVAQYEKGGWDGSPEFMACIPADWSEQDVRDLLVLPMKKPETPYPAWEVAARAHGSDELFRWWKGEKPR